MVVDRIRQFIDRHHISGRIVVACSGGADSTALLIALSGMGADIVCGHVNHHLRGDESDGDEQFVRDLCRRLGVELHVADGSLDPELVRSSGVEAAARAIRERRLREIAGTDHVATAHQRNDQAETVVMRIASGTGIAGLRGVLPIRADNVIRPLLNVTRKEIEQFLAEKEISPRSDRMNSDPRFLRTRVREALSVAGPDAVEKIASVADDAQEIWPAIEKTLDTIERACARVTADETHFLRWPGDPWWRQALLYRHIRRLGSAREISSRDLERLTGSLDSIKRLSVTKDLELIRRKSALVLRRVPEPTEEFEMEVAVGVPAYIPAIHAMIRIAPAPAPAPATGNRQPATQLIQLPRNSEPAFTARNRRRGDRFQPLGMPKDKKLKDFLIDRKIPADIRDRIPLLIWRDEIVWVGGVAVSERFKVTNAAGELYEVVLEDASQEDQDSFQR